MGMVRETGKTLESSGYHQQVVKSEEMVNLFLEVEKKRSALKWSGESIQIDGVDRKLSQNELRQIIEQEPERLSPNVLLLPFDEKLSFPNCSLYRWSG